MSNMSPIKRDPRECCNSCSAEFSIAGRGFLKLIGIWEPNVIKKGLVTFLNKLRITSSMVVAQYYCITDNSMYTRDYIRRFGR